MRKRILQVAGTGRAHFGVIDQFSLSAAAVAPLEVRLNWTDPTAPADTSYQIERANGTGGWYRVGTSYSDRKEFTDYHRDKNTAYTYRIRSSNSTGLSGYSAQVAATTMNEDGAGEFVGPLAGWRNFKTYYGADNTGVNDCSAAFNTALTDLAAHSSFCVLWLPAGTYKITSMISSSSSALGVAIIGENPATTKIKWGGSSGVDMMHWDAEMARFSRITFDGSSTANIALGLGGAFSSYNEVSDCVFQDCAIGLQGAGLGQDNGTAETLVLRCHFVRCSVCGSRPLNANSLDWWYWYCRFQDCAAGVNGDHGDLSCWYCYFSGSTIADCQHVQQREQVINCVSIGSAKFIDWGNIQYGGQPCVASGNRAINSTDVPITLAIGGPFLCMDNILQAPAGWTSPILVLQDGPTLIAGNLYSIANAAPITSSIVRRIDEEGPTAQPFDPAAPALPGTPPNLGRTIFEVSAGANASTIQAAINNAVAVGNNAVVHLAFGSYNIATTLSVPANARIQILGDVGADNGTVLNWTGAAGQPLIHLVGPSKATLKDFKILAGAGIGILADGADQPGGHVYSQMLVSNGADTGLYVNGLDQTDVTAVATGGAANGQACVVWTKVRGGTLRGAGSPAPNRIAYLTGACSQSTRQFRVENGGELVARSIYHEASPATTVATLDDRGKLSIEGNRLDYEAPNGTSLIEVNGHAGDLLVVGSILEPLNISQIIQIRLSGSGALMRCLVAANDLVHGDTTQTSDQIWFDTTSPAGQNVFFQGRTWDGQGGWTNLPARGSASDAMLRSMLNNLRRGTMRLPGTTPAGVTDIRMSMVIVGATAGGQSVTVSA